MDETVREAEISPVKERELAPKIGKDALAIAAAVLLTGLIISGTILYAVKVGPRSTVTTGGDNAALDDAGAPKGPVTVSIDDDPVLGDLKKAKVAIVEFSDFECPFCKRFHDQTFGSIMKDYVDTGKIVFVHRDMPLPFHDPKATEYAQAVTCVRDQKGDKAYYEFGGLLFANSQMNGKGLPEGKFDEIVRKVGANPKTVSECVASGKYKKEVEKDIADGAAAGIQGTPGFIIGKLDGKNVTGDILAGAYPYEQFKAKLDELLK